MVSDVKGELGFCPAHLAGGGDLPNTGATHFLAKPSRRRSKASAAKEIGGKRVSPRDSEFGETLGVGRTLARLDTWLGRKSSCSARPYGRRCRFVSPFQGVAGRLPLPPRVAGSVSGYSRPSGNLLPATLGSVVLALQGKEPGLATGLAKPSRGWTSGWGGNRLCIMPLCKGGVARAFAQGPPTAVQRTTGIGLMAPDRCAKQGRRFCTTVPRCSFCPGLIPQRVSTGDPARKDQMSVKEHRKKTADPQRSGGRHWGVERCYVVGRGPFAPLTGCVPTQALTLAVARHRALWKSIAGVEGRMTIGCAEIGS
jgi:hypothetical protein